MPFRTRALVLHPPPPQNAAFSLFFIISIFTLSSDRCSFFIGLYSFYASYTAKLFKENCSFSSAIAIFVLFIFFNVENLLFLDMPLSELQEMSITSLPNNSITLRRSCNAVVTSLYKNSPDVNNCKQDSQSKS